MKPAFLLFSLGMFALSAQTLLFRGFLQVFAGSELVIGAFFGSWLLWVALGAAAVRIMGDRLRAELLRAYAVLPLLVVPCFLLQHHLVLAGRQLLELTAYDVVPLPRMLQAALLFNAPLSLITGMLFPLGCLWLHGKTSQAVAKVYALETLGGFVGGLTVTVLLALRLHPETIFLYCALLPALAGCWNSHKRQHLFAALFTVIFIAGALLFGLQHDWVHLRSQRQWGQLLPEHGYVGSFTTSHSRYSYGTVNSQLLISSGNSVVDALPDPDAAAEIAAITLAQHPSAKRVLLLGDQGLGLINQFLAIPEIVTVTWLHPDPSYPTEAIRLASELLPATAATRLVLPSMDIRQFVRAKRQAFDLVILNLAPANTLYINRLTTLEFYQELRQALAPDGIVAVQVPGDDNFFSDTLAAIGAGTYTTLARTFARVILKPGGSTWLLAGDAADLTAAPAELRDRLARVSNASSWFPPAGLFALFPPERIAFQHRAYEEQIRRLGPERLVNHDAMPRLLLRVLLHNLYQSSGHDTARRLEIAAAVTGPLALLALLIYLTARLLYRWRYRPQHAQQQPTDALFLLFAAAGAGMTTVVVLMMLVQVRFGALFLYVGMLSSLFMLGLYAGNRLVGARLAAAARPRLLMWFWLLSHLLLPMLLLLVNARITPAGFALLFLLAGGLSGGYVPLVAHELAAAGKSLLHNGSGVEVADSLGGMLGAFTTGVLLLPVVGLAWTLALATALLLVGALGMLIPLPRRRNNAPPASAVAAIGFGLAAVAIFALATGHLIKAQQRSGSSLANYATASSLAMPVRVKSSQSATSQLVLDLTHAAAELAPATPRHLLYADPDQSLPYLKVVTPHGTSYVLSTAAFAPNVLGYGGPINLVVRFSATGVIEALRICNNRETPAYLALVRNWLPTLHGKSLLASSELAELDGVSGATVSCQAIRQTLAVAGARFAQHVQLQTAAPELAAEPTSAARPTHSPVAGLGFAALVGLALWCRWRPARWKRALVLLTTLTTAGLWLNLQFSSDHLLRLVRGDFYATGAVLLGAAVLGVVVLFGNIYCGYLCPFGALQELVSELRPRSCRTAIGQADWRSVRVLKYLLLFGLAITAGAGTLAGRLSEADPLVFAFIPGKTTFLWILLLVIVLSSLLAPRFWCRSLCPTGACLALLSRIRLLRVVMPAVEVRHCDLGVERHTDLDCICCDRCRIAAAETTAVGASWLGKIRLASALLAILVLLAITLAKPVAQPAGDMTNQQAITKLLPPPAYPAGTATPVDPKLVVDLQKQGVLADHPARHYRQLSPQGSPGATPDP